MSVRGGGSASFASATLRMSPSLHRLRAMDWPLLAGIPKEDARVLLAIARRRMFGKGEVVFHRDDPADSLHLVVRGRFGARVLTPLGDSVLVDVLGPGQSFGELALFLPDARRSATVEALEAGETRSIFRNDFAVLQREHPAVKDVLLRLLAEQLRRSTDRVVEAHYVDAETRVRRRLVELASTYEDGVVPLTQEDIAAMAGTSRATVNRVLREEARLGAVALARGRTTVLDSDGLERRCRRHA
jgi:CRP/FNR family transcriptional regulator, cyclic AMP receptor protein